MSDLVERARQLGLSLVDATAETVPRSRRMTPADALQHGLTVADWLTRWQASTQLIAAGLLHSLTWQQHIALPTVAATCDADVAELCRAYREVMASQQSAAQSGDAAVQRRIRGYIAAYRDPRLAVLAVADGLAHLAAAVTVDGQTRRRLLDEAVHSTAPLCEMLGMSEVKAIVDEMVFTAATAQRDVQALQARIDQSDPLHHHTFEDVSNCLRFTLPQAQLRYRRPTPSTVHSPHSPEQVHPEALHSLTVDALVPSERDCYLLLHAIHRQWTPVDGSVDDHISAARLNGQRSLKTSVQVTIAQSPLRVDFHICTPEMDEINRWGIAAFVLRSHLSVDVPNAWWQHRAEGNRAIQSATPGSEADVVHIFSPQGELFALPRGCSVVDFAYRVHSGLANQCKQFLLNGVAVAPTAVLRHLDLVELVHDPLAPGPTRVWLDAAKTSRARHDIRRALRRQGRGALHGQRVMEAKLRKLEAHYGFDIPKHQLDSALDTARRILRLERVEDLFAEVAAGRCSIDRVLHPLFAEELARQIQLPGDLRLRTHQIKVAQCCRPRLGDDIVGRPRYRGDTLIGLKVHRADCERGHLGGDDDDVIPLGWWLRPPTRTIRRLDVSALDEPGLLGDALKLIYARPHLTLHKVEAEARHGQARMRLTLEADQDVIDQIERSMRQLPNHTVEEVRQMQLQLSEWEALAIPLPAVNSNPYSRLPVNDRDMLFGRRDELARIHDLVTGGAFVIVRGQKRIGKTSLLLHLRDYKLDAAHFFPVFVDFQAFSRVDAPGIFYEIANAVYQRLQSGGRLSDVGAPVWNAFAHDAPNQFERYLRSVRSNVGGRLVLLLDEFSVSVDAMQRGELDGRFFAQCRALIPRLRDVASLVAVIQQVSFDRLRAAHQDNPAWQLLELGESVLLRPLAGKEIADLIERPVRNYTRFGDGAIERIGQLTGGSPFLTQAFCLALIDDAGRRNLSEIDDDAVDAVIGHFLSPDENLFTHLLDLLPGRAGMVARRLAALTTAQGRCVLRQEVYAAEPAIEPDRIDRILANLIDNDLLIPCAEGQGVRFAALLFARWLQTNERSR